MIKINQSHFYYLKNLILKGVLIFWIILSTHSCTGSKPAIQYDLYPPADAKIKNQVDWQKELYTKRIDQFKKEPIGNDKIVFLGNSLTEGGGNWNEKFGTNNIVNRGISGDITEGVFARLGEIYRYKPRAVFLLIGINDIFNALHPQRGKITTQYVAQNIIRIADKIKSQSPSTKVFIQTVLPVNKEIYLKDKGWFPEHSVPLNNQINEINRLIKKQNKYPVIDLHSAFINRHGNMNEIYTTDGVHLNEAGYKRWVDFLMEYVKPFSATLDKGN